MLNAWTDKAFLLGTSDQQITELQAVTHRSTDNYLLAMAEATDADYLVTGDKRHVLAPERHGRTGIITAAAMLPLLGISK